MNRGSKNRTSDFYPCRMLMDIQKLMTATAPLNILTKAASNMTSMGTMLTWQASSSRNNNIKHSEDRSSHSSSCSQGSVYVSQGILFSGYALQRATLCVSYRPSWTGPSSEGNIHLKANSDVTWTLRQMISVLVTLYVCNLPRSRKKKKWPR